MSLPENVVISHIPKAVLLAAVRRIEKFSGLSHGIKSRVNGNIEFFDRKALIFRLVANWSLQSKPVADFLEKGWSLTGVGERKPDFEPSQRVYCDRWAGAP
jgi:hypothetical protein